MPRVKESIAFSSSSGSDSSSAAEHAAIVSQLTTRLQRVLPNDLEQVVNVLLTEEGVSRKSIAWALGFVRSPSPAWSRAAKELQDWLLDDGTH